MLNSKSFLSFDFGAGTLKAAEFEINEAGALRLVQFGTKPLGLGGSQEAARERVLLRTLQELLAERGFGSRQVNVCAPGFHVFSKFLKLPPVDSSKVTQIIQYEAQQNVPFPLEEVVWDYQILGALGSGELEVLLVAIKADLVESLFRTADAAGLRLGVVDVSPAALCNAFRYNYGDLEGCTMLLDIGAKTSNLLFFEKGKVFARGINIGANSITQDFAAEAKLPFAEAEKLKIAEGFVSLGGAYEEPDNPRQAAISKIARQVLTRLHIQVNQTIQFYRGQQGGAAPQQLYLAGGASVLAYTAQFFAEKLNLGVEYFNPFRNVEIDPSVNLEELAGVAHSFGEVVGAGLRQAAECPIELNLIPKKLLRRQQFDQKKPYFIAAVFSLVAVVFAYGWFFSKEASVMKTALSEVTGKVSQLQEPERRLRREESRLNDSKQKVTQLTDWLQERFFWGDLLREIRRVEMATEDTFRKRYGLDCGVWVVNFVPNIPGSESDTNLATTSSSSSEESTATSPYAGMSREMMERYGLIPSNAPVPSAETTATNATAEAGATNEISQIKLECRGVNVSSPSQPAGNKNLVFLFQDKLTNSPLFDPQETKVDGPIQTVDPSSPSFRFDMTIKLTKPVKL